MTVIVLATPKGYPFRLVASYHREDAFREVERVGRLLVFLPLADVLPFTETDLFAFLRRAGLGSISARNRPV